MTFAKAFVTGVVKKTPEKRFTQNDMPIVSFTIDIDQTNNPDNEILLRVIGFGQMADNVAAQITQGDNVAVEGRLQINNYKLPNGKDKKVYEINAGSVEKIGTSAGVVSVPIASASSSSKENIVNFDSVPADDLIDEDEIPF